MLDMIFEKISGFYKSLSPKERTLFFVAIGMVSLLLFDRLVIGPILTEMKVVEKDLETREGEIAKNLRVLSFKNSIIDRYSKFSSYFDPGDKTQQEIIADLLKKIENLARQQNISIANIKTGEMEDRVVLQEYRTNIDCEGKLSDMFEFMHLLEQSDSLFQVTQYSLIPKAKGSEEVKCSMTVSRMLIAAENIQKEEPAVEET